MVENLGVEILATARHFDLEMPLLHRPNFAPGESTPPSESPPLSLRGLSRASVTAQCTLDPKATRGIRIQVLRSDDGSQWRTAEVFEGECRPGQTVQTTFALKLESRFAKILLANRDPSESLTNLTVAAKLGASD